ncbi:alpha/beta fold hydrolase [Brevundimonas sp. FT23028]|uniref:alpha/beta fold hydrolase n=1 Tax=Brevundimonas sp. FT23028 TaxID=3393748 RepID=UPI003B588374
MLILIPGLLNDSDLWRDQVTALSDRFDLRVADITRGETMEALVDGVFALSDGPVSVAGFSLGGYVAQAMLMRHPERIERLALLDTAFRPDTPERAAERAHLTRLATASGKFLGIGDRLLGSYLAPDHVADPDMAGRVKAMTRRLGAEVFIRQSSLIREDGAAALRAFAGPALVLCGEVDRITPPEGHREMAALLPNAELVIAPGCGHLTPIEAPGLVSGALARWMER